MRLSITTLIFLLLAATARLGRAQQIPGTTPTTAVADFEFRYLTRADTARAVHELFKSRRGGGSAWLGLGVAGIAGSTLPALQTTSAGVWTPGVVAGSFFTALGLKKWLQFGIGREHRLLRRYAATGHLPPSVTHRLRGPFQPLHGTPSQPNPLARYGYAEQTHSSNNLAGGSPRPSPAAALADARTDTLDAVQGFYLHQRFLGSLPALAILPAARLMSGASNTSAPPNSYPGQQPNAAPSDGAVAAGLLLAGSGLAFMLIHNAPYTKARYAAFRDEYLAGKPLPPGLRARLKPKYFQKGREYRENQERRALRR